MIEIHIQYIEKDRCEHLRDVSCTSWDPVLFISSLRTLLRARRDILCSADVKIMANGNCSYCKSIRFRNHNLANISLFTRNKFAGDRDEDPILPYFKDQPNPLSSLLKWVIYFKSRRWGFQMLIRLTNHERIFFRHLIIFFVGMILRFVHRMCNTQNNKCFSKSLSWSDPYIRNVKAFIEFRTNILNKVNFSNFDNVHGVSREIIPNFIHYIRLEQPDIR